MGVYVVVWGGNIVVWYLYSVGPSRRNDLGIITLVVWRGNRRHRICQRGNVRMRGGGNGKMKDIGWCGV